MESGARGVRADKGVMAPRVPVQRRHGSGIPGDSV